MATFDGLSNEKTSIWEDVDSLHQESRDGSLNSELFTLQSTTLLDVVSFGEMTARHSGRNVSFAH